MSITYPIEFVARTPSTQRITLNNRQSITESNETFTTQAVQTASQWQLSWTWPKMTPLAAESVDAWIVSLKGQVGTFRYYPVQAALSGLSGITLAQTAYQYGTALLASGFGANTATTLRAGQFLQLGDQLLKITIAPANADGSGHATINFEGMLRQNFSAGTTVNFANPCGLFRLNASADIGYTVDSDGLCEFSSMTAREAL